MGLRAVKEEDMGISVLMREDGFTLLHDNSRIMNNYSLGLSATKDTASRIYL